MPGWGAITGIASLIFGIIAVVFCLTAAAFITGVCLLVAGIVFLVASPLDSGLMFGIAIAGDRCGTSGSSALIRHSGHVPPIFMEKHEKGGSMDFT